MSESTKPVKNWQVNLIATFAILAIVGIFIVLAR